MKKLATPTHRRTTSGTSSIVIFITLFAHLIFAEEIYSGSGSSSKTAQRTTERQHTNDAFLIEQLQPLEVQLDKFENFLRLNPASFAPAANATLSEIQYYIDRTRQSIEEFKVNNLSDANHATKIISLHSDTTNLQTSLGKLKQGRFIPNNILENAHNLAKLLNNFNSELDDFRDEVEKEKAAKRLRDETVDYIKHNDILHINSMRTSVNNLQNTIENQRKEEQKEIVGFKEELWNLLERKAQKDKDDMNSFQKTLLREISEIINGKVEDFKHEFESLRKEIEQKENRNVKMLADNVQLVRAIKSSRFSEAEKTLKESDNSTYTYAIGEVYDNQVKNFDLLLRFAQSIRDFDCKFKVYHALCNEMSNNGHRDAWDLLRLRSSVKTELLNRTSTTGREQSLYDSIPKVSMNETERSATKVKVTQSIYSTILSDSGSVVNMNDMECFQCMIDICEEVIKQLWNKLDMVQILARAQSKLINVDEQMAFHIAVFHELQRQNEVVSHNSITLSRHMKLAEDDANYQLVSSEARSQHAEIKNKLPRSVKNLVFSSAICVKNNLLNEYLYASKELLPGYENKLRRVFTQTADNVHESSAFKWRVIFTGSFQIKLQNVEYNQTLFADDCGKNRTDKCVEPSWKRTIFVWNEKDTSCSKNECHWTIKEKNDSILIENFFYKDEFLHADRRIIMGPNARYVFTFINTYKDTLPEVVWDVIDCS